MLPADYRIRALSAADAPALAAAYDRNRGHLAATNPVRAEAYFTTRGQQEAIAGQLAAVAAGLAVCWVLLDAGGDVAGRVNLQNIVRGAMQGGTLGYWVDARHLRRGLARGMIDHVAEHAVGMGLHRLEADTLTDNTASRALLRAAGFTEIGMAPRFLFIAGAWRDHVLHQRILHDEPPPVG